MNRSILLGMAFLALLLSIINTSRAGAYEKDAFSGQKIVIAGTGDSQELLRTVAAALETKFAGVMIEVPDSTGSGGGIKALLDGKCDLARVARPLKEREKKSGLTYKLFARSPVVFVVHPSVSGLDNLNSGDIIGVYSGKITNWDRLGARPGKIYPIIREPGDSSREILNALLPGFQEIAEFRAKVVYTTPETLAVLTKHCNTMGFLPMTAVGDSGLKVMKIDNFFPSPENVNSERYKFVTPLALVYHQEPTGLTKAFIDFLFSGEGAEIIRDFGAIPSY